MNYIETNYYDRNYLYTLYTIIVILVICVGVLYYFAHHNKQLFLADRACRPGIVHHLINDNKVLCIGGNKEVWVVEIE